jgi:hypothetical protein
VKSDIGGGVARGFDAWRRSLKIAVPDKNKTKNVTVTY